MHKLVWSRYATAAAILWLTACTTAAPKKDIAQQKPPTAVATASSAPPPATREFSGQPPENPVADPEAAGPEVKRQFPKIRSRLGPKPYLEVKVIQVVSSGGESVLLLNKGSDNGIRVGDVGTISGHTFRVFEVHKRRCKGRSQTSAVHFAGAGDGIIHRTGRPPSGVRP